MNLRATSATPRPRAASRSTSYPHSGPRRLLTAVLAAAVALTGLALVTAAPAQAAQPAFACDALYSNASASPHGISRIDAIAGTFTGNGQFAQGSSDTVNALALPSGGGRYIWGFNRQQNKILRYDATTETVTQFAAPTNAVASAVVAGAINPANGLYYYAAGGSSWTVFAFDTTTNTAIGQVATISATSGLAGNGDMAFDALGNLYLTSNADATAGGFLSRVTGTIPTTAGNAALGVSLLTTTPANSGQYTSIAIDEGGQLAIGTSTGKVLRVNPSTGQILTTVTVALSLADLASCSVPSTGTVKVNLPSGRYAGTDQFGVAITGGGVTSGNTGTTTGTDTGLQDDSDETGGAVLTQRTTTYTVTQTAAGTTNLGNYTTTWACKKASDGSTLSSGTGSTGSYTSPATAADVICTFTNTPLFPAITLTKTAGSLTDANGSGRQDAGDTLVYGYAVTNTGATALTSVAVTDTKAGAVTCPKTTLAIGESMTCTSKTYTLTQADVDAGQVVAPATATGVSPTNATVTDTRSTTTTVTRAPSIDIDQTASAIVDTNSTGKQDAGDTVTYGHLVTNTGTVTLTGVTATDPTLGTLTCPRTTLAPGEAMTCTPKAYVLTQANVNAGSVVTTATATGTPPAGAAVTGTDTTTVPITRNPAISLTLTGGAVTDVNGNGVDPGDTITYTFKVTNTGNVTLNPVTVTDPLLGAITCPSGAVAPGASITCTNKSYPITQADIDAGQVVNAATATGTPPAGANVTDAGSVTTPITQSPSVAVLKTASAVADTNSSGKQDAGDKITYSFKVTNTGNVTLSSVGVTDARIGTVTCPTGPLAPGANVTCTAAAYTLTQADVDAGKVVNTATASATSPKGVTVTGTDTVTTTITQQPAVKLVKSAGAIVDSNADGKQDAGDTITYAFVVTNTGTTTLSSISTTDTLLGAVTCPGGTLAPGASTTCTPKTYVLTQADVNAGTVGSPATTTALSPANVQVTSTSSTATPIPADPRIAVTKTASAIADTNGDGMQSAGDKITYSFTVTNTGNVTLNPATVTDTTVGAVTCPGGALQPGQSVSCTDKAYTLTQADVTAGFVSGTATASGTPPTGAVVTATASTTTPIASTPRIALVKTASAIQDVTGNGIDAGDTITYTFKVTNTGNVPLNPVTVTDGLVGAVTCPGGSLAPGATITCTDKTYPLTQADIDAGTVVGTATTTGKPPTGASVSDSRTTTTPVAQTPAIRLVKSAGPIQDVNGNGPDAGDTITYTFKITNTGNTTMSGVKVTDPKVGTVTCPSGPLAPGASVTCTPATYTLTQADVNSGRVDNSATAEATSPLGVKVSDTSSTSTPIAAGPSIDLDLTVGAINDNDANGPDAGDTLTYGYVVTNTGNVTLTGVGVNDPRFGAIVCPGGPLAPGASLTCTSRTYTLTQADVDAGTVPGTATATGTPPTGANVTATDTVTSIVPASPVIALVKTASAIADTNSSGRQDAGDTITYAFKVTNTGNVTLSPVTVTDTLIGAITCPSGPLAPGASTTCTPKSYVLTQGDVDAGVVAGPATATGTAPGGTKVTSTSATSTPVTSAPAITLVKTASAIADTNSSGRQDAGDAITYTFKVTNTGNVTLDPVTVTDTLLGAITCPSGPLAPGASTTCTPKSYVLTQADVNAGVVAGPATATGTAPTGTKVTSTSATSTPITAVPAVRIDKTASAVADLDGNGPDAGDQVTYSFVVTNTGNVTLDPVTVSDTTVGAVICPSGPLAPGASRTCAQKVYTLTQVDVDAGSVTGTATVTGTSPAGAQVQATDTTATPVVGVPSIRLVKTASAIADLDGNGPDAGDQVTYSYVVTNTGAVTLDPVTVTDALLGSISCPSGALAPGASITCTPRTYTLTQADVDAGTVGSPATATGTAPGGAKVTSTSATATPIAADPRIKLTLTASPIEDLDGNGADAGDRITYQFTVRNTGNVTLDPVTVSDPKLGAITCPTGALAPGASVTCTPKAWLITQAEVTAGAVTNSATATGTAPGGAKVSDPASVSTPVAANPGLRLDLVASSVADTNGTGRQDAGDTITYGYTVTNTGNVPLQPVVVADPLAGPVTCPAGALAPGASVTCTSTTYVVTQADLEAGSVLDTSTATGTAPDGTKVSDPDSVATPLVATPSVALVKTAGPIVDVDGNGPDAGDTVTYSYKVTNTGNLSLTGVTVVDDLLGPITCPTGALAPGASLTCTPRTYTLTQADVTAGTVGSPATATGTTAGGTRVSATDATATPIPAAPRVRVVKSSGGIVDANGNGPDAGDTITYTFTVTNTGNVPLGQVHVTDTLVAPITCPDTVLQPGDSLSCSPRVYTLTQADVDNGEVANTATVDATSLGGQGGTTVTGSDSHTVTVPHAPSVRVDLTGSPVVDLDGNGDDAGDRIDYTITVTNTGNVRLVGVAVTDPDLGPVTCPKQALAPGESMICTVGGHTLTQADVAAGSYATTATVTGTSPTGTAVTDDDTATTPIVPTSTNIATTISVDDAHPHVGDTVTYTVTVTDTGDAAAQDVVLKDPLPAGVTFVSADSGCTAVGSTVTCALGTLQPGQSRVVHISATVNPLPTEEATYQHDLDVQKVEAQIDLEAGQTRTVTTSCAPGYLVTDGSGRVDAVDQGTGTLASVHVLASQAVGDGTWSVTVVNDGTGRAQAKVFAVCVRSTTEAVHGHQHDVVVSSPVTRTADLPAGRTDVTLSCDPGLTPVAPSYVLDGEADVLTSYPSGPTGWTFGVVSSGTGGAAAHGTFAIRCLDDQVASAAGHTHGLDLSEVRQSVTVPAGQVVEVQLTCADNAKGIVAGWDLDPGLVDLGNDPRPKTRAFKLLNPTDGPLDADLYLLCLGTRTLGGDLSGIVRNTATASTPTPETSYADNAASVSFTVDVSDTGAPRPAARAASASPGSGAPRPSPPR